jgi:tRNA G18 (ribose-2'-O)-methylase SpoU
VIPVDSLDHPGIAAYRQIAEPSAIARAGLFVAEGRWVVERLLARPRFTTESVLVSNTAHAALFRDAGEPAGVPVYVVDQTLMDRIVGFNIHRGCLALARRPEVPVLTQQTVATASRVLVLEGVNNPDNVGGIFRSAAAFGVDIVVLGPGCGDPFYRKAIRTSMAATLDVPYVESGPWPDAIELVKAAGLRVAALTPATHAAPLDSMDPRQRFALMLGTEGGGLTPQAMARADARVCIRMTRQIDSLNVTVAASIVLHHLFVAQTSSR